MNLLERRPKRRSLHHIADRQVLRECRVDMSFHPDLLRRVQVCCRSHGRFCGGTVFRVFVSPNTDARAIRSVRKGLSLHRALPERLDKHPTEIRRSQRCMDRCSRYPLQARIKFHLDSLESIKVNPTPHRTFGDDFDAFPSLRASLTSRVTTRRSRGRSRRIGRTPTRTFAVLLPKIRHFHRRILDKPRVMHPDRRLQLCSSFRRLSPSSIRPSLLQTTYPARNMPNVQKEIRLDHFELGGDESLRGM
ncbi:hypothetical protein BS17DRAFT_79080 [Gyrodon lividus]|nr:hypothetical protein BS17DRAFT_79080 [Gyrodon lividus]